MIVSHNFATRASVTNNAR